MYQYRVIITMDRNKRHVHLGNLIIIIEFI